MEFSLQATEDEIREAVLNHETIRKWIEEKEIKKFILVKGRIINVVI